MEFRRDRQLFLTENDIKCFLYNELRKVRPSQGYAVHSEVTHYAKHADTARDYRFRDLVLLNPAKITNNIIRELRLGLKNKGFRHIGESIFFEIKFQRNENDTISINDFSKLKGYHYQGRTTEKYAIFIWGSKHVFHERNDCKSQMIAALNEFSGNRTANQIPDDQVFGFVFNHQELWEVKMEDGRWKPNKLG
jgi:hypothetical protein